MRVAPRLLGSLASACVIAACESGAPPAVDGDAAAAAPIEHAGAVRRVERATPRTGLARPTAATRWDDIPVPGPEWHLAMPEAPEPAPGRMVFDEARGRAVLFQGGTPWRRASSTWEFDGTAWSRRSPAHSPTPRSSTAMAYDAARGRTVLFGGYAPNPMPPWNEDLDDTWEWDGDDWTSRTPTTRPPGRHGHAMTFDAARNVILLVGGYAPSAAPSATITWTWDGTTWTPQSTRWSPGSAIDAPLVFDRARSVAVLFQGNGETWEWNGVDWMNRTATPSPPARPSAAMAYDVARRRTVLHGGDTTGWFGFADTWEWDGSTWVDRTTPFGPMRAWHAMTYDTARGEVLLFGGNHDPNPRSYHSDTWSWDGANWSQRVPDASPSAGGEALVFDEARGELVLFVGEPGAIAETWTREGTSWTRRKPRNGPTYRYLGVMAYDAGRGKTVLFGGSNGVTYDFTDTWEWDGSDWALRTPTANPPGQAVMAMAYDRSRSSMVLANGAGQTWTWDGSSWTRVGDAPASAGESMAYDEERRTLVLLSSDGTYEWDGTTWSPKVTWTSSTAGRPSSGGPLVYDRGRRKSVLFAQAAGGDVATWEWDGTSWTPRSTAERPAADRLTTMAFDASRNETVLFGGDWQMSWSVQETWVYWGPGAHCTSDTQCHGARCVDGVCCDSACGDGDPNDCVVCSAALGATADGVCTTLADGAACSDGDACTRPDTCLAGHCTSGMPVFCPPVDECHAAGVCDPSTGACTASASPDGTACSDDGEPCTRDVCIAGACTHAAGHANVVCRPSVGACDLAERCDGTNPTCPADARLPVGARCAPSTCVDGAVVSSSCDGAGDCIEHASSCGAFACRAGSCIVSCKTDLDCASRLACDWSGQCLPRAAPLDAGDSRDADDDVAAADAADPADGADARVEPLDADASADAHTVDTADAPNVDAGDAPAEADAAPSEPLPSEPSASEAHDACGCRTVGGAPLDVRALLAAMLLGATVRRRRSRARARRQFPSRRAKSRAALRR